MDNAFEELVALVQYTRENGSMGGWRNMAAFDSRSVAERYAENCSAGGSPWIYRVVDVEVDTPLEVSPRGV